jgi:hypothetical protein
MFMISLGIKFHMPGTSGSLVTAIKLKAKENEHTATMMLFYILQKYFLEKIFIFSQDLSPINI